MEYLPRIVDLEIQRLLSATPIVTIEGARATGKTTTAQQFAASEIRLPRELALLQSDPVGVLSRLDRPALIDEWQLAGVDVLWALKEIVDGDPRPGSFILTGSVEPETYGATYPLTGRSARVVMHPMNARELAGGGHRESWIERLTAGGLTEPGNAGTPVDIDVVTRSGFPAVATIADPTPWLLAYADSVAQRGLEARHDPARVGRLLRVLAELEGSVVPDERIWTAADINRETYRRYEAMLERTHVVQPARAWQTNRLKRVTALAKRYFVDTALALALAGIGTEQLRRDPALAGHYFDSFVASQIRSEIGVARGVLHHVRTKAGEHEIDMVIEIGGTLIAIEVKSGVQPVAADAKHLAWFRSKLGDAVTAAAVIHRGSASFEIVPGVWALPVSSLWS